MVLIKLYGRFITTIVTLIWVYVCLYLLNILSHSEEESTPKEKILRTGDLELTKDTLGTPVPRYPGGVEAVKVKKKNISSPVCQYRPQKILFTVEEKYKTLYFGAWCRPLRWQVSNRHSLRCSQK